MLASHLGQGKVTLARLHYFLQTAHTQFSGQQGLTRSVQSNVLIADDAGLQTNRMLQPLHELVLVVHDLWLHGKTLLRAPALLHLLRIALQLIHLSLRGLLGPLTLLQGRAGGITLSLGGFNGDIHGIQG